MEILGLTLELVGTILIAFMALKVHHHVLKEHKIDEDVFKEMRYEQVLGVLGIGLLIIGFLIQLSSKV